MELTKLKLIAFLVVVIVIDFHARAVVLSPDCPNNHETSCANDLKTEDDAHDDMITTSDDSHDATRCRDDHDECVDRSQRGLCDSDPIEMLLHCRKSCLVCPEVGVKQNVGLADTRVPIEISIGMLRVLRETNQYYFTKILNGPPPEAVTPWHSSSDPFALIRRSCQNRNDLCSLWRLQNRCASPEYGDFMMRECPLACQLCDTEKFRALSFLKLLSDTLPDVYYSSQSINGNVDDHQQLPGDRSVVNDRIRALSHVMLLLGMDPELINKPLVKGDGPNWVEQLHDRIMAAIPSPLLAVYDPSTRMDDNTENLLRSLVFSYDKVNKDNILVAYRHRGYVYAPMMDFDHFITRPVQLAVGFAVPNGPALNQLESEGKILQMGAGTGYWTALLRLRGVDVVAYDLLPPARAENSFFDTDYSNNTIEQGGCVEVLSNRPDLAQDRTLLMIWPNDPDPIDNPEFCDSSDISRVQTDRTSAESEAVWDASCLWAYMQAGGERVVYVGEREEVVRRAEQHRSSKADSGLSATRAFQQMLQNHFELVTAVELPNWWLNEDDITTWKRKRQ